MASLDLKDRYKDRWRWSILREFFVLDYLQWLLLSGGFTVKLVGLGAGRSDRLDRWHGGGLEALDMAVYTLGGKLVAVLDVTGYQDPRRARGDSKRCIGVWKLEKARIVSRDLGLPLHRVWFAHFTDSNHILVFINAERLAHLAGTGVAEKRRLYDDEKPSLCLDLRHWTTPRRFLEALLQYVG